VPNLRAAEDVSRRERLDGQAGAHHASKAHHQPVCPLVARRQALMTHQLSGRSRVRVHTSRYIERRPGSGLVSLLHAGRVYHFGKTHGHVFGDDDWRGAGKGSSWTRSGGAGRRRNPCFNLPPRSKGAEGVTVSTPRAAASICPVKSRVVALQDQSICQSLEECI